LAKAARFIINFNAGKGKPAKGSGNKGGATACSRVASYACNATHATCCFSSNSGGNSGGCCCRDAFKHTVLSPHSHPCKCLSPQARGAPQAASARQSSLLARRASGRTTTTRWSRRRRRRRSRSRRRRRRRRRVTGRQLQVGLQQQPAVRAAYCMTV
jgi:hypothetical protein